MVMMALMMPASSESVVMSRMKDRSIFTLLMGKRLR